MPQAVIVPEDRIPSYLNRQGLTWAKIGTLGVLVAVAPFAAALPTLGAVGGVLTGLAGGALIGTCSGIGCIRGKETIERNQLEGKIVKAPSIFNEGMAQGALNGAIVGMGAFVVAAAVSTGFGAVPMIIGGLGVGLTGATAYFQGKQHAEKMTVEYEQATAKAANMQQGLMDQLITRAKGIAKPRETDVTKDDVELLESRIKGNRQKTRAWAEKVQQLEEDRQNAMA